MTHKEFSSRGGKIGGRSTSPAKRAAATANAKLATAARIAKSLARKQSKK